ncbi:hypothetical protein [Rhodococcoides fascians]|uniref:hypothetical protein n=1 Tax=Rhodococcoides fascians TaxID=1828 RepID=UPI000A4B2B32|nr:hypothetical protein [Rhodococcus fascians]
MGDDVRAPDRYPGMIGVGDLVVDTTEPMRKRVVWTVLGTDQDMLWLKDAGASYPKYRTTHSGDCYIVRG